MIKARSWSARRALFRNLNDQRGTGVDRQDLLRRAAFEVGRPIGFGVAIIVAVCIPIFTLEGIEGRMLGPIAWCRQPS